MDETFKNKVEAVNNFRRITMLIMGIFICSLGMALLVKANLGQSTLTGISYNLGIVLKIRTGTMVGIINYLCFLGQVIILRGEFKKIQILQIFITSLSSNLINFFIYTLPFISNLYTENYILKLIIVLIGTTCIAYGVILMIIADLIIMPFEAFAKELSIKYKIRFGTLRRYIDITLVILSLLVIFIYKIPNTSIREGTIIYTYFSGILMNFFLGRNKNRLTQIR